MTREEFTRKYYPDAYKATRGTGIFPETLLGMAIVESQGKNAAGNWEPGAGLVARRANNYFGIKDFPKWKGPTIDLPTPGDAQKISRFVVYSSIYDSFAGFVDFLKRNPRYEKKGVFTAPNYGEQITRIAAAGYAENPNYATVVKTVADKLRQYIKTTTDAVNNNRVLFPLLFAGALVAVLLISKSLKK
jgi:flagellum-specific peptidoglycan hydrolase FlgJ